MSSLIADLYREKKTIQEFKEAMIGLDSTFSLDRDDFLELGHVYCDRYPESYSKRNPQNVRIGYAIARICIIEKSLEHIIRIRKDAYRDILYDINAIEDKVANLIEVAGCEQAQADYQKIMARIKDIEAIIESLPRGMIKEKFIGGLSVIYNVIYLLQFYIEKCMKDH